MEEVDLVPRLGAIAAEAALSSVALIAAFAALSAGDQVMIGVFHFVWFESLALAALLLAYQGLAVGSGRAVVSASARFTGFERVVVSGLGGAALATVALVAGEIHGLWWQGILARGTTTGAFEALARWTSLAGVDGKTLGIPALGPGIPTPAHHVCLAAMLTGPVALFALVRARQADVSIEARGWRRAAEGGSRLLLLQFLLLVGVGAAGRLLVPEFDPGDYGAAGVRLWPFTLLAACLLPPIGEAGDAVERWLVRRRAPPT